MIREKLSNIFFKKTQEEDPLDRGEALIFIIGLFQAANAFLFYDEPGLIKKVAFYISVVSIVIFFVFAFTVRRNPSLIILISFIFYAMLTVFDNVIDHSIRALVGEFVLSLVLAKTLYQIRNPKQETLN